MLCCIMSICIQLFFPSSKLNKYNIGEIRFDENHPYYVPNVASFNLLEKSVTAYGKRTNRLGEIHLIKEETAVKIKMV